nr:MAG TPA: hypothetical protein [Caudoviricetes sp.]
MSFCYVHKKMMYATKSSAMKRLNYERKVLGYQTCSAYLCKHCGAWHLTSVNKKHQNSQRRNIKDKNNNKRWNWKMEKNKCQN